MNLQTSLNERDRSIVPLIATAKVVSNGNLFVEAKTTEGLDELRNKIAPLTSDLFGEAARFIAPDGHAPDGQQDQAKTHVPDQALLIPGYSFLRRDRRKHGGGVALYYRSSLGLRRLTSLETQDYEVIWFQASTREHDIIGCAVCGSDFDITQHLQHALDEVSIEFNTIVLLAGDLNAHHPDLSESISTNTAGRLLQRFATVNALTQDAYEEVLGRLSKKSRPTSRRTNHERHQHNTLNQELIRPRATQQAASRLHSTARTRETHQSLVTARQEFTLACANHIRRTDEATVKRMTESSNAKQWQKYCKKLYRGSAVKEAIPIMTVGTKSYITSKDKATILNQTFIAKSRASSRPRFPSLKKRTDSTLADILFNEYRVKKILQDLNINKASANTSLSHPNCHPEALVYADDTMLYRTGKDPALICPAIEEDLRIAGKWADIRSMRFNASKTVAMYISRTTATPPPITFAGATLEYSHEHRHLGFILDSAVSFHAHLNALTRKGATEVFLLRRLSYKVKDRDLLLKIYKMSLHYATFYVQLYQNSDRRTHLDCDDIFSNKKC
ncbi:hypothetical protein CAPTEDRAFT_197206 [Capitella teleta]|uniref:Endonuclease/exonuclease/phosphatase domain-containing protein n=1 Tax=Capitella teleta TaxID=283909 RepID=R7UCZ9_CAPTE|nr:hypothetical protein CAPTEDRAFT_197206 [Capitella teleta]|eukprot:ELU03951.1 hypothetical protein CAPTEDRAFT_197206 [Capitella teleta]